MEASTDKPGQVSTRLRAVVEIIDGELKIYPIADSDEEAKRIMDSLLFWKRDA